VDLAQALALPVVLVVGMRLGCLNHALLTVQAIDALAQVDVVFVVDKGGAAADLAAAPGAGEEPRPEPPPAPPADGKSTRLRIYVDRIEAARPLIESVLERDAKRWSFEAEEPAAERGAPVLAYRVRPRKSVGLEGLRGNLLREGAPHVVAADDAPGL